MRTLFKIIIIIGLISISIIFNKLIASPSSTTDFIHIDQFGYACTSKKVAVISDPQTGFNSALSFNPGTGINQYQLREWNTDAIIFSGTLQVWSGGVTHTQSGDRGWWFDFSSVTSPGDYYIFDTQNNVGSYRFRIADDVYNKVLENACRVFFYQRLNYAKQPPYVPTKWSDNAAFEGIYQDRSARSSTDKNNASTVKDLHGGWMDAGDVNKYITFTFDVIPPLLEAYRTNPGAFKDDYNIPESGNNIPDILDEVKWELDWMKRMQDGTGTNGFLIKVGQDNYSDHQPLSTSPELKYWVGECTSSTIAGALSFAIASTVYSSIPSLSTYATDLRNRAVLAWNRAVVTTSNFTNFQTTCDDQSIKSGDADYSVQAQREMAISAAVYLYEATGNTTYRTFVDANYLNSQTMTWWGPYYSVTGKALLRYSELAGATASVANNIKTRKANSNHLLSINDYNSASDLYRSYMPDAQYQWGSNMIKSVAGNNNLDFATFNINVANNALYREVAEQYIHYIHGVNPLNMVMLTNMYDFGGEKCANEIYHAWFYDGTNWDNAQTSLYGPPPGYLVGGPNRSFSNASISPPYGQPPQKSYKDWNTSWNGVSGENSWEITEPAIYYQANYIALLAGLMNPNGTCGVQPPCAFPNLGTEISLCNNPSSVMLNSSVSQATNRTFTWGRGSSILINASSSATTLLLNSPIATGTYWVRIDTIGCSRTDSVMISNSISPINLGPNLSLCSPASVSLNAGVSGIGYNYEWERAGDFNFANLNPIQGQTNQNLNEIRTRGLYRAIVTYGSCSTWDTITINSSLPTPQDACISTSGVANLSVINPGLGAGPYNWYSSSTGGTLLATGSSYSPNIVTTTTYYVQDASIVTTNLGPTNLLGGTLSNNGIDSRLHLNFSLTTDFTLNSFKVPCNIWSNGTATMTIEILDGSGNPFIPAKLFTSNTINFTTAQHMQLIPISFTGATILSSWGSNLRMRISSTTNAANFQPLNNQSVSPSYPYNTTPSGLVTITASNMWNSATPTTTNYMYFYDWQISTGLVCDRLPVIAAVGGCNFALSFDELNKGVETTTLFENSELAFYPNPTEDNIYICSESSFNYSIMDIQGRKLLFGNIEKYEKGEVFFVKTDFLIPGTYIIQLINGKKVINDLLIIK